MNIPTAGKEGKGRGREGGRVEERRGHVGYPTPGRGCGLRVGLGLG